MQLYETQEENSRLKNQVKHLNDKVNHNVVTKIRNIGKAFQVDKIILLSSIYFYRPTI